MIVGIMLLLIRIWCNGCFPNKKSSSKYPWLTMIVVRFIKSLFVSRSLPNSFTINVIQIAWGHIEFMIKGCCFIICILIKHSFFYLYSKCKINFSMHNFNLFTEKCIMNKSFMLFLLHSLLLFFASLFLISCQSWV